MQCQQRKKENTQKCSLNDADILFRQRSHDTFFSIFILKGIDEIDKVHTEIRDGTVENINEECKKCKK